jgi:hypothetical protein
MATVSNITLEIGTTNVGPERSIPIIGSTPPDTRQYRLVTVRADLNFTPEEMGLSYRVRAALFATDSTLEDSDDGIGLSLREDAGVTQLENMVKDNNAIFFLSKEYNTIVVNATVMPQIFTRKILLTKLDEDPKVDFDPGREPERLPHIYFHQDELFARVTVLTVGQSATTHVALF